MAELQAAGSRRHTTRRRRVVTWDANTRLTTVDDSGPPIKEDIKKPIEEETLFILTPYVYFQPGIPSSYKMERYIAQGEEAICIANDEKISGVSGFVVQRALRQAKISVKVVKNIKAK